MPAKEERGDIKIRYVTASLLVFVLMIGVGFSILNSPLLQSWFDRLIKSPASDAATMSQSIASQCAMGKVTSEQTSVSASLAKYLSGISSGTIVKTFDVGAIVEKITPDDRGEDFYRDYTDCLKQEAALYLGQRGVSLVAPTAAEVEAQKDETIREDVSELGLRFPKARLIELFGQPIESDDARDYYQYKHMLFVEDVRKNDDRVALFIITKDPLDGSAMFPDQINGIKLSDIIQECHGFLIDIKANLRTGICPSSRATNFEERVFFSFNVTPLDSSCSDLFDEKWHSDLLKCPSLGNTPMFGVALAPDQYDEKAFSSLCDQFVNELDEYIPFTFISPSEQKELDKDLNGTANLSADESLRRRKQLMIKPITPAI